jgi:hypothetical protein
MMQVFNHRRERWELRDLNTDEPIVRRRTLPAISEARALLEAGELVVAFPEPYDWAVDGV